MALALAAATAGEASGAYSRTGPYLDFGAQVAISKLPEIKLARDGMARVKYPFGWQRNPVTTANIGLQAHAFYLVDGRRAHRRLALRTATGLVRAQEGGVWRYAFPFTVGGMGETLEPGWISAMSQGLAMSLLTRAYEMTGRRVYLRAAVRALRPFRTTVPRGGVVRRYEGRPWYEEYPTPTPSYVLNGFGFTLLGLYDLAAHSAEARKRFRGGYAALLAALPRFDAGSTSWYHLGHMTKGPQARFPASPAYNHIHVLLLDALDYVRPHRTLRIWREQFRSYDR
ncbi:MAG: hypothetical protein GXY03_03905 [Solirubrobacterales bacterium]|nr:hypothetical protein [Solirubrobacterales bacterium]